MRLGTLVGDQADLIHLDCGVAVVLPEVGMALEGHLRQKGRRQCSSSRRLAQLRLAAEEVGVRKATARELALEPQENRLVSGQSGERRGCHWSRKRIGIVGFIKRLDLALALHNHQPAGNFGWVIEETYERSYLPLVEALERHPDIRVALHYTGYLLDHLAIHHPDFLDRVRELATRGQVEVMGGGYFEPILPAIPDRDKHSQALRLSAEVKRLFGTTAAGFWLAERVWEPALAKSLAEAGYTYAILDDSHFELVGIRGEAVYKPHLTEEQGRTLVLLATPRHMRYSIPWHPVETVMAELRELAAENPRIAVMGDDGEKFGAWPTTYKLCWTDGWVERFFTAIEESSDWLRTVLPRDHIASHGAVGPVYLPAASYPEMLEWSGGFWRNFLVRYPEVNALHKKMLRTSERVNAAFRGRTPDAALIPLLRGQANDAYWHGVFGGIYLPHLRRAAWSSLLEAEGVADRALHGLDPWQVAEHVDIDADGSEEVLIEGSAQNAYLAPAAGGALIEWDVRAAGLNLIDCIARRQEPYHSRLRGAAAGVFTSADGVTEAVRAKEPGLEKYLDYDRRRRLGLQVYLAARGTTASAAAKGQIEEIGGFGDAAFEARVTELERGHRVTMRREESIGPGNRVRLTKTVVVRRESSTLEVAVSLENLDGPRLDGSLIVETNLAVTAGRFDGTVRIDGARPRRLSTHLTSAAASHVSISQPVLGIAVDARVTEPVQVWHLPIETVNNSEAGYERVTQGVALSFVRLLSVGTEPTRIHLRLRGRAIAGIRQD